MAQVLNSILGPLPMGESDAARDRTPFPDKGGQAYASHARTWLDSVPVQQRDPDGRALDGACTALLAMSDSRPMAVVTHAHVIAWFAGRVLGAPEDAWLRIAVDNASVTTLDRNSHGEVVLRRLNASWAADDVTAVCRRAHSEGNG